MKKIFCLVLALVMCACTLVSCKKDDNVLTCGITIIPGLNEQDADGNWIGFESEFAMEVGKILGMEVKFQEIDWAQKYNELNSGAIDCVWNGFTANCADDDGIQRADKVDFTYNYMTNAQCILRLDSTADVADKASFGEVTIAYEAGSAAEGFVADITGANLKEVSSQMNAVMEVKAGTAQYAVVDYLLAKSLAGQSDYANLVINEGITIDAEYYAIGFKKGSDLTAKVNEKLVAYAANGTLATLAAKYGLSNQVITDYTDQIK